MEYNLPIEVEITPRDVGAIADTPEEDEKLIHLYRTLNWQTDGEVPHNVGGNRRELSDRMIAAAAHEFAHKLTRGFFRIPEMNMSWDEYKIDARKRGFKVAEAKRLYEGYLRRREKMFQNMNITPRHHQMLRELAAVAKDYDKRTRRYEISQYADKTSTEFFSEAFAYVRINGRGKNQYADRVVSIINKYKKK